MSVTLNTVIKTVNEWNQPTHNPLIRMVFTRIGGIACVALEARMLGVRLCKQALGQLSIKSSNSHITIYKLFLGIVSSALFGVIISPEINIRIHSKLYCLQQK